MTKGMCENAALRRGRRRFAALISILLLRDGVLLVHVLVHDRHRPPAQPDAHLQDIAVPGLPRRLDGETYDMSFYNLDMIISLG